MTTHKTHLLPLILINSLLVLGLAGCASGRVPQNGPTMAQVYETAMNESDGGTLDNIRNQIRTPVYFNGQNDMSGYTRTADNETENLFPTLPNPQLVMYVYPHLAGADQAPVPGYATAFSLYRETHYALPGEISVGAQ